MDNQTVYTLVYERTVDVLAEDLYRGWTDADLLVQWFTPKPWRTTSATIELRHGGAFATTMEGPNGESISGEGCILHYVDGRKLIWTNTMRRDYVPNILNNEKGDFGFTTHLDFVPKDMGAIYKATVYHQDQMSMKQHEDMGFYQGWNAALDQLIELLKEWKQPCMNFIMALALLPLQF